MTSLKTILPYKQQVRQALVQLDEVKYDRDESPGSHLARRFRSQHSLIIPDSQMNSINLNSKEYEDQLQSEREETPMIVLDDVIRQLHDID